MIPHIGERWELFVDAFLVEELKGLSRRLHAPQPREIAVAMDSPWEGPGSGVYATAFHDGQRFRLYYRASDYLQEGEASSDLREQQYTCLAVSDDGIHWEKEPLGLFERKGSRGNNILFAGRLAHNFAPFLDTHPACSPAARYKAVAGHAPEGLRAFQSPDGLRWTPMREEPVITKGAFDSHNVAFDPNCGLYRCYSRYFAPQDKPEGGGVRAIQSCVSQDFLRWSEPVPNDYGSALPLEQFYTNATVLCPGAPHLYLSFPMRFVPERHKVSAHKSPGVSDAVFLSSRDGLRFDRSFREAWIRPDLSPHNWTQRCFITACGILETGDEEFSFYVGERYCWEDACIRRYALRRHGFASVRADADGGKLLTRPFVFEGARLLLNYATSAAGHVRAGILDAEGRPLPGFALDDCAELYGNALEEPLRWRGGVDVSALAGRPLRLTFDMRDADLYALRFAL